MKKILKNNYDFNTDNTGTLYLNSGLIYIFTDANDFKGFDLTIKYMIEGEVVIDVVWVLLRRNHKFLTYIFEKHEYLIQESLEINPELKDNPTFKKYLNQHKLNNF